MSNSAINTQVAQLKIGNVQNQADNSAVYSGGVWSLKNSTALTSVTITDAGNVGIGTASPALLNFGRELVVSSTSGGQPESFLCLQGARTIDANVGGLVFFNSSTSIASIAAARTGANNSGALIFGTVNAGVNAERMRIDASGNLSVSGGSTDNVHYVSSAGGKASFYISSANVAGKNAELQLICNGSNSGGLTYERSTSRLIAYSQSGGAYLSPTATSWVAVSDERSKKNIKPLELGLEQIKALKPARFDYNSDESEESARVGFIAQEVLPVLPHAVSVPEDSEQMMGVSATEMIPVLVKAIQELSAQIEELKAKP